MSNSEPETAAPSLFGGESRKRKNTGEENGPLPKKMNVHGIASGPNDVEDMRTLVVSEEKKRLTVPAMHLISSSRFFRRALKPEWDKNGDNTIPLPSANLYIVKCYVFWLYKNNLSWTLDASDFKELSDPTSPSQAKIFNDVIDLLIDLYIQAHAFEDPLLCNQICTKILFYCKKSGMRLTIKHILQCWERDAEGGITSIRVPIDCALLRLLRDFYILAPEIEGDADEDVLPTDFVKEVAKEASRGNRDKNNVTAPTGANHCRYHEHSTDVPQCSSR